MGCGVFIDSATIYDVTAITRTGNTNNICNWIKQSALASTTALINMPNLKIAPAPSQSGAASGIYDYLMRGLSDVVGVVESQEIYKKKALKKTKDLNGELVKTAYSTVIDDKSFQQWLEQSIEFAWVEHSSRLNGLFNREFIPQLTSIIGVDEKYLFEVWKLSCDVNYIHTIAEKNIDNDEVLTMKKAYMISALLRGYFHDTYAKAAGLSIIHHPFRKPILPKLDSEKISFQESNTESYLSNIILSGALFQSKQKNRINVWLDNIRKARKGVLSGDFKLSEEVSDGDALDLAIKAAKKLELCTSAKWIDEAIDISINVGSIVTSSFILQNWDSLIFSAAAYVLFSKLKIGTKVNTLVSNCNSRLSKLAIMNAGRIEHVNNNSNLKV
ncbi:MAG TPA: hypothetical protein VN538_10975 [Clostridia bacterium]|nr:hypothetical protein [Clostridia bacterium]